MDGSIEILENWYKEKVIPGDTDRSVEALAWVGNRLFSAGLTGEVFEYDLLRLAPKVKISFIFFILWLMKRQILSFISRTKKLSLSYIDSLRPVFLSLLKVFESFYTWLFFPFLNIWDKVLFLWYTD